MKRYRLSAKARQKQMDSLRDIAIFALEPTQGMSALNELATPTNIATAIDATIIAYCVILVFMSPHLF